MLENIVKNTKNYSEEFLEFKKKNISDFQAGMQKPRNAGL